jgi:hypothetical protein
MVLISVLTTFNGQNRRTSSVEQRACREGRQIQAAVC